MSHGPTFQQVRALVEVLRRHARGPTTYGLYSPGRYSEARHVKAGDDLYCVAQCDSLLQMRVELQKQDPDVTVKVLVTPLKYEQLEDDVCLRLFKRRLHPLKTWDIVKSLLQARHLDARIARDSWLAEALLAVLNEDCPKVASGVLDAETAWGLLLSRRLGLEEAQPDLVTLLAWSMEQDHVDRFRAADETLSPSSSGSTTAGGNSDRPHGETPTFFGRVAGWLGQSAGPAAPAVLGCVRASPRPDALPLGLALGVIFHPEAAGQLERAAGRVEQFCGGLALDQDTADRWARAAAEVVRLRLSDAKKRRPWLDRADELLRAVGADSFARLSDLSPLGLRQRLLVFANHLTTAVAEAAPRIAPELRAAAGAATRHLLASSDPRCGERMVMALRLVRWLAARAPAGRTPPPSFAAAARDYAGEGGFVDWARHVLRGGEAVPELARAYTALANRVAEAREAENRVFAALLRDALAAGSWPEDAPLVEQVLDRVVAPLAADAPILLLVLDGMSQAVFRELLADLLQAGWVELQPEREPFVGAVAALPSWTEASRASLLCGELCIGRAPEEKAAFARHRGLLAANTNGSPPVLFHKATLQDHGEASLAAEVRQEIASAARRVVGVVINAVDNHLSGGEQTDPRWGRDYIKPLPALLDAGRAADRLVVLVSDHGHVLDQGTEERSGQGGERWRIDDGRPAAGEVRLAGPRVLIDGGCIIVPWSERVRYVRQKNGYHGGASPQEMIVPLAVLSAGVDPPPGWREAPVLLPRWWDDPAMHSFPPLTNAGCAEDSAVQAPPSWIDNLLESEAYRAQRTLVGEKVPSDDQVRGVLSALAAHGGKIGDTALAARLHMAPSRVGAVVAGVRRLLNAEGYGVLARDEASGTIELKRDLLVRQFEIGEHLW